MTSASSPASLAGCCTQTASKQVTRPSPLPCAMPRPSPSPWGHKPVNAPETNQHGPRSRQPCAAPNAPATNPQHCSPQSFSHTNSAPPAACRKTSPGASAATWPANPGQRPHLARIPQPPGPGTGSPGRSKPPKTTARPPQTSSPKRYTPPTWQPCCASPPKPPPNSTPRPQALRACHHGSPNSHPVQATTENSEATSTTPPH